MSWKILTDTFGRECTVNTPYGRVLSIEKVAKLPDVIDKIKSLGIVEGRCYSSKKGEFIPINLIGYTPEMKAIYSIEDFVRMNHHHFTTLKKKVIIHA